MLDGRSWTLAEVPRDDAASSSSSSSVAAHVAVNTGRPNPPAVVTQHIQIDRQFVVINSKVTCSSTVSLMFYIVASSGTLLS